MGHDKDARLRTGATPLVRRGARTRRTPRFAGLSGVARPGLDRSRPDARATAQVRIREPVCDRRLLVAPVPATVSWSARWPSEAPRRSPPAPARAESRSAVVHYDLDEAGYINAARPPAACEGHVPVAARRPAAPPARARLAGRLRGGRRPRRGDEARSGCRRGRRAGGAVRPPGAPGVGLSARRRSPPPGVSPWPQRSARRLAPRSSLFPLRASTSLSNAPRLPQAAWRFPASSLRCATPSLASRLRSVPGGSPPCWMSATRSVRLADS